MMALHNSTSALPVRIIHPSVLFQMAKSTDVKPAEMIFPIVETGGEAINFSSK